ncbi:hypothetical protein [Nocardia sp. NPDC050718]|uniref:hypothetical protein n=1 Tax=Nocardia sp. NPDC050718 TaxID=3155788 RepID=UPI0033EB3991
MTVEMDCKGIRTDRSTVCAVAVGAGQWSCPPLRGRIFTADQALALVVLADTISEVLPLPAADPRWRELEALVRPIGLTLNETVRMLELCDPAEMPWIPIRTAAEPDPCPVSVARPWSLGRALAVARGWSRAAGSPVALGS